MKTLLVLAVFALVFTSVVIAVEDYMYDVYEGGDDDEEKESGESQYCPAKNAVCASLMMTTENNEVIDEGELCKCAGCVRKWGDKKDKRAVTWYHQERRDFLIQYRLCSKILPDELCLPTDEKAGLKITTGVENWKPKVSEARCQCPGNIYYMGGWWRRKGRWEYSYVCKQATCDVSHKDKCFKQYRSEQGVEGVTFLCGCPDGFKCPLDQENSKHSGHDEHGDYTVGFCVPLYGSHTV